ncbi:MAG: pseudouridine synthase [Bacillota bacterium]
MRLAKYLAQSGVASRRHAEEIIRQGRVEVNEIIIELPQKIVSVNDTIKVDGKLITGPEEKIYILLNKPPGYISTVKDTHGRPTVIELIKDTKARVYPVGRLDVDTSGVLLMTNDGELAHRLTHPRYQVKKTYHARVTGVPSEKSLAKLREGIYLEEVKTAPAGATMLHASTDHREALLEITLAEGKKRQVKKMCAEIGHPVINLKRVTFAGLDDNGLPEGAHRFLVEEEINYLYKLVQL